MTVVMYLNNFIGTSKNYGRAGAVSAIMFVICAVLCVVIMRTTRGDERTQAQARESGEGCEGRQSGRSQATMKVQPKTKDQQTAAHAVLTARRIVAYAVLILLCALCLFFFYVLIINATRPHADIQEGLLVPAGFVDVAVQQLHAGDKQREHPDSLRYAQFAHHFRHDGDSCVLLLRADGVRHSCVPLLKGRTLALTFILLIMTMPTQASALGFVQLVGKMNLKDSLLPLFLPSIASPAVSLLHDQYMQASLPLEVIEAARIDGSSEFGTFNRICSADD